MRTHSAYKVEYLSKSSSMVKFDYTILYVSDVERSLQFYEQAFGFARKFLMPDYGELLSGETTLAFAAKTLAAGNLPEGFLESSLTERPFAIEVGMVSDDVAQTLANALQAGAVLAAAPKQKPWGQVVAYVRDPDGFLVEICSPMN
jgi:catechol 2,3-dioxygenase-like lactoylglutathione lyase family enzyme